MNYNTIVNKRLDRILIFGDLHLHDNHKGRHINYLKVCLLYMNQIRDIVREENPDCIIFLGDIIGVREKIIKNRVVLLEICKWFEDLNSMVNGELYTLRGNHDFGQNPEFDFLHGLGYFKTTSEKKYIDMTNENGGIEMRLHLVDYGSEKELLEFCHDEQASNVVLFHNDMKIEGQTTWYTTKGGFDLSKMYNWEGCDMAIGGHIHNPSPWMSQTTINGKEISLFYPGCGTRPTWEKNIYNWAWCVVFDYEKEDGEINYDTKKIQLEPEETVFYPEKYIEDLSEDEIIESVRREDLHGMVKDLIQYRIADGDPVEMIKSLPNTNPKSVEVAVEYLNRAFAERGQVKR